LVDPMMDIPSGVLCEKCGVHKATEKMADGDMAFIHGEIAYWCRCCAIKTALEHSREAAARIATLEKELSEIQCA